MTTVKRSAAFAGVLAVALAGAPLAQASTGDYMNPVELQQAVLRAQPGGQLGAWTQNFYFSDKSNGQSPNDKVPLLCPSATKQSLTLPKADSYGLVGYAGIDANTSMGITIWQYQTDAQAQAAKEQFLRTSCPDTPLIQGEDGTWYQMTGGGADFSESQVDGVPSHQGGYEGTVDGGSAINVYWAARPVGKAFVRVEVRTSDSAKSSARFTRTTRLVRSWIDRASRAVLKFSSADPNADTERLRLRVGVHGNRQVCARRGSRQRQSRRLIDGDHQHPAR